MDDLLDAFSRAQAQNNTEEMSRLEALLEQKRALDEPRKAHDNSILAEAYNRSTSAAGELPDRPEQKRGPTERIPSVIQFPVREYFERMKYKEWRNLEEKTESANALLEQLSALHRRMDDDNTKHQLFVACETQIKSIQEIFDAFENGRIDSPNLIEKMEQINTIGLQPLLNQYSKRA